MTPILSIELEHAWQGKRPILFLGVIKNISSIDNTNYRVEIEKGLINSNHQFASELRLSLKVAKKQLDAFLADNPKLAKSNGIDNGIAVVAKVQSISVSERPGEGGDMIDVKTGNGELVELVYTGDMGF
jgi:hypothetical protein